VIEQTMRWSKLDVKARRGVQGRGGALEL